MSAPTKSVLSQALEALEDMRNQILQRGVSTDPEHPDRVALNSAEDAIASLRAALADEEAEQTDASKLVKTAPPVVYLQVSDDRSHYSEPFPHGEEITWCADSVMDCEVRYLRADLIPPSPAALRAAVIEECARVAMEFRRGAGDPICSEVAAAIRALKTKEQS